jgi:hypothetical protein
MKIFLNVIGLFMLFGCTGHSSSDSSSNSSDTQSSSSITTTTSTSNPIDNYSKIDKEYKAVPINIPVCDANNPKVAFIKEQEDWQVLNNQSKRIFCVKPGKYHKSEVIIKNSSGTKEEPKYIILDNGNDEHPAKLSSKQIASVDLHFESSNYWIVDRMSSIGSRSVYDAPILFKNSSNNIINREFTNWSSGGVLIRNGSHNNTIQNSRFQNMSKIGAKEDRVCILFLPTRGFNEMKNTHILHNELHNCSDGIQPLWGQGIDVNYEGTVIYGNDISVDSNIYTDCHGHYDKNGKCSYSENAIDMKAGSKNPDNKILIKKNRLWGFRKADETGSKIQDPGAALVVHYGTANIVISENIIFDSARGIQIDDKSVAKHAILDSEITNNYISNIFEYPLVVNEAKNILVSKNSIINSPNNFWLVLNRSEDILATDNKIINSSNNLYQQNTRRIKEENSIKYNKVTRENLKTLEFITDIYTNNPRKVNPVK